MVTRKEIGSVFTFALKASKVCDTSKYKDVSGNYDLTSCSLVDLSGLGGVNTLSFLL